jgi:DNA-binding PucR family transcriptional regulator
MPRLESGAGATTLAYARPVTPTTTWQQAVLDAGSELGFAGLTEVVADVLHRELAVLREDRSLFEAARSSSAANVALIVEIVRGTLRMDEFTPPPQAVAFAREVARRNVAVTELGRAYRLAQHALWRWAVGEVHARLVDPETIAAAIEGLSEAAFATGDVFSTTMMERYAEERERWLRSAQAVRGATVRSILAGGQVDPTVAGRQLGYELRQDHQAFVVWGDGEDAVPETIAAAVGGGRALLLPFGIGVIAGWAPPAAVDLSAVDDLTGVALGVSAPGLAGFARSHHEAMEARRVAQLTGQRGTAVRYEDIALLALLTQDLEQARTFATRILGPLAVDDTVTRRLAQTLLVVLQEQGSPRRAGQRLGVHENTIAKRLRAIEERGGPAAATSGPQAGQLMAALLILGAERPDAPA